MVNINLIVDYVPVAGGVRIRRVDLRDPRKAYGKPFVKLVKGINFNHKNGYAFQGDFIPADREVEVPDGSLLLIVRSEGSWKHPGSTAYLVVVENSQLSVKFTRDWKDKVTIRDEAAKILEQLGQKDVTLERAIHLLKEVIQLVGVEKAKELLEKEERCG